MDQSQSVNGVVEPESVTVYLYHHHTPPLSQSLFEGRDMAGRVGTWTQLIASHIQPWTQHITPAFLLGPATTTDPHRVREKMEIKTGNACKEDDDGDLGRLPAAPAHTEDP